MALSTFARLGKSPRLVNTECTVLFVRFASVLAEKPKFSDKKWSPPSSEPGYFKYERDFSRDSRYSKPQKLGDTVSRALTRKLGHAYEVYPIFGLVGIWFAIFCYTIWISFDKMEIWLDRSQKDPPWDWERIRNNYWKKHTLVFDPSGQTHQRLMIMEKLQDQMIEAAKERGTR